MARYDDHDHDDNRRDMRRSRVSGGAQRGEYYDPDHEYRTRRYQRDSDREQPYANRPMPGEYADRQRHPRIHRPLAGEEHAWSDPTSWYGEGRFRGIGPKGYARSDERIRELVCDDLMDDAWLDASAIEVAVKDGEVTLSGSVDSREAKRLAEDIAEHAGGAKHVQNNLRIVERGTPH